MVSTQTNNNSTVKVGMREKIGPVLFVLFVIAELIILSCMTEHRETAAKDITSAIEIHERSRKNSTYTDIATDEENVME